MRKYALVVFNIYDQIIDRLNFDLVTNSTGNGFVLNLSTLTSDVDNVITKVVQKKGSINFTIISVEEPYTKATLIANFIQKYSLPDYEMALEYDDDETAIKYTCGKVTSLTKTEKNFNNIIEQDLIFTQTTPFFIKKENNITIEQSAVGKKYPFKYPYRYGKQQIINNEIDNIYITDVPVNLRINGTITNPFIQLLNENGQVYNSVLFDFITIRKNQSLFINSAQRKIRLVTYKLNSDDTVDYDTIIAEEDYSPYTHPQYDTYLRAKVGKSTLTINSDVTSEFSILGTWRQYTL